MPTDKRQRQREGRRARLEAVRKVERRRQGTRRAIWIVVIAGVILGTVFLFLPGSTSPTSPSTPQGRANEVAVKAGCPASPYSLLHPKLRWFTPPPTVINPHRTYLATVKTTVGTFSIRLATKASPVNVNNFVFLAQHGYYTCVIFHRVIVGFMDQTGDPTGTGSGTPGYVVPKNEFPAKVKSGPQYRIGDVAMANRCPQGYKPKQCPLTNGAQFFIVAQDQPALPPEYTIIGHVTSGVSVIEAINNDGSSQGTPNVVQRMLSVTITSS